MWITYLDAKEIVQPFSEVAGKVPSGLSDDVHSNVMPWHPMNPIHVVHVLLGSVQNVKVSHSSVAIILSCKVQCSTR